MTVAELIHRLKKFDPDSKIVFTEHDDKQYTDIDVFPGHPSNPDGTCMMTCGYLVREMNTRD